MSEARTYQGKPIDWKGSGIYVYDPTLERWIKIVSTEALLATDRSPAFLTEDNTEPQGDQT